MHSTNKKNHRMLNEYILLILLSKLMLMLMLLIKGWTVPARPQHT